MKAYRDEFIDPRYLAIEDDPFVRAIRHRYEQEPVYLASFQHALAFEIAKDAGSR